MANCRTSIARNAAILSLWAAAAGGSAGLAEAAEQPVDFSRDVRPILADKCFHCHGNDPTHREADLRLDVFEPGDDFQAAGDVLVPGEPDESYLVERITSDDPEYQMPPADSGKTLTPQQIETLRKWIAQGAEFKQHWSFVPPERPAVPEVKNTAWVRNPIDAFVLARLEQEGLEPSPRADAAALLRRLSLDLIGLPPTLAEVEEFAADTQDDNWDDVYQAEAERLLASVHYGERWGRVWLDAARYADSDGFEKDKPREVWKYRDWVVEALNADMPYDEFVVEQLAGDLLPNPTQDQRVATGFLRNSMINQEGGIDPEQFRMEAMFDRIDAVGKAVLGLTIQCAQCHTHKYDPLTHAEYYGMFAFINNCHEAQVTVYTDDEERQWRTTAAVIDEIEDQLRAENPDWPAQLAAWEASVRDDQPEWTVITPKLDTSGGQKLSVQPDGSILASGYAPSQVTTELTIDVPLAKITAIRLELLGDVSLPHGGPGRSIHGLCALTEFKASAAPLAADDKATDSKDKAIDLKFASATADVNPLETELAKIFDDGSGKRRVTGPIAYANDGDDLTAWGIDVGPGRSNVPRKAVFVLDKPLETKAGAQLKFKLVQMHGQPYLIDTYTNNMGRYRLSVTSAEKPAADPVPADVRAILRVPPDNRSPDQVDRVFSCWRTTVSDWQEANRRIEALWQSHPRGTSQLVVVERDDPRKTHRLDRGSFLAPAEEISPGVPSFLHSLEAEGPTNRLTFARWLADRRSPTTARSIVNRVWQSYFGVGLVATAEDLGTQGEPPSHPELLDWLAVELMDNNWSLKHLHRLIVDSATYRQASRVNPQLLERDPENRLLARGPRYRVDAEVVRDMALSTSGLLNDKVGGPSVYPPAPEFLFKPPASYAVKTWHFDTGPDRYRRALYTFRYRSVPYPVLQNFDAPPGDIACARRARANTPLQALTTLNEALFLECARALAVKTMAEGGSDDRARLAYAVRRCLSREPQDEELQVLQAFLDEQKKRFRGEAADPWALLSDQDGEHELPAELNAELDGGVMAADLAAWTALARVVLNLDETITKE